MMSRKFGGSLIGLFSILCLWFAFTKLATASLPSENPCQDLITKELSKLVEDDKTNILDLQLKLTTFKLAAVTRNSRSRTVEEFIKKQDKQIKEKDKNGVRDRLVSLYERHQAGEDVETAADTIQQSFERFGKGSYWNKKIRFKNRDLSAFVLTHQAAYPDESPFSNEDSAILWMQSYVSEAVVRNKGRWTADANLQEASTQVARLTGVIRDGEDLDVDELLSKSKEIQNQIGEEFDRVKQLFSEEVQVCLKGSESQTCSLPVATRTAIIFDTIADITSKLEQDENFLNRKAMEATARNAAKKGAWIESTALNAEVKSPEIQSASQTAITNDPLLKALYRLGKKTTTPSSVPSKSSEMTTSAFVTQLKVNEPVVFLTDDRIKSCVFSFSAEKMEDQKLRIIIEGKNTVKKTTVERYIPVTDGFGFIDTGKMDPEMDRQMQIATQDIASICQ